MFGRRIGGRLWSLVEARHRSIQDLLTQQYEPPTALSARSFCSVNPPQRPTKIIEALLTQHGPQTADKCWKLAQPAGIPSKTRLKSMLRWLVEQKRVRKICNQLNQGVQQKGGHQKGGRQKGSSQKMQEFLFCVRPRKVKRPKSSKLKAAVETTSVDAPPENES